MTRFFIQNYNLYEGESRIVFDLLRVDETGGLGLQGTVFYDCAVLEIEIFIVNDYLPNKGKDPRSDGGAVFMPRVLIGDKFHYLKDPFSWFMLIPQDEKFDILNAFVAHKESDVLMQTNNTFARRAVNVEYTTTIERSQLIAA